eukprot:1839856-Pleurochrysis_carterae.AAC.1
MSRVRPSTSCNQSLDHIINACAVRVAIGAVPGIWLFGLRTHPIALQRMNVDSKGDLPFDGMNQGYWNAHGNAKPLKGACAVRMPSRHCNYCLSIYCAPAFKSKNARTCLVPSLHSRMR